MKRKIVHIDEDKCNGCGLCIDACHEVALKLVDGKARLVSDEYCDGLGDCLPECPTGAITIIEREAEAFDEELVQAHMQERSDKNRPAAQGGCPGQSMCHFDNSETQARNVTDEKPRSYLGQWPIQISLVNPRAGYLQDADLLIAADCTAYAHGNFHEHFMAGRITLIGCPKLDQAQEHKAKLVEIFRNNPIKSVTVVKMEVPCCQGLAHLVKQAMQEAGARVIYSEVTLPIAPD